MTDREEQLEAALQAVLGAIRELTGALDATRLIMGDKDLRDMAGNMVKNAREIAVLADLTLKARA